MLYPPREVETRTLQRTVPVASQQMMKNDSSEGATVPRISLLLMQSVWWPSSGTATMTAVVCLGPDSPAAAELDLAY